MSATDRIKKKLARLSFSPGVYLMKDAKGGVIYVGKAAVLKNRVRSYFHKNPLLDTPQLAGGRKAEIRRRRISLLSIVAT